MGAMSDFKVGDRVKVVRDPLGVHNLGDILEVLTVSNGGSISCIRLSDRLGTYNYYPSEIEPIKYLADIEFKVVVSKTMSESLQRKFARKGGTWSDGMVGVVEERSDFPYLYFNGSGLLHGGGTETGTNFFLKQKLPLMHFEEVMKLLGQVHKSSYTIILEDGSEVKISEESYKALQEGVK